MPVQFAHAWMGIAIPSVLILYLQCSTSYIIFTSSDFKKNEKLFIYFQIANILLWISYYLAIITPAGSPDPNFQLSKSEFLQPQSIWRKYCVKCDHYKPDRTHHCKKCGTCVLKMDHHCPWTNNCIGYFNLPHFMRFLFWIIVSVSIGFYWILQRIYNIYMMMNLPSYLVSKTEMAITIVNFLLIGFVLLTISILFIRSFSSIISNQTMIESWECERIQDNFFTENFWIKIRRNYAMFYPENPTLPDLKSWKVNYRILKRSTKIPLNFTYDDLVFPYDLGSAYENLVDSLGPIYTWLYPFGVPTGDGLTFIKDKLGDDQLKLPFPPDGNNIDDPKLSEFSVTGIDDDNELVMKNWANYMGETLDDFGVDLDTEDYEISKLK
jgi:palmitoyltransferase